MRGPHFGAILNVIRASKVTQIFCNPIVLVCPLLNPHISTMSEQETAEYYDFLLWMEWVEFEQELIEIVSKNFIRYYHILSNEQ